MWGVSEIQTQMRYFEFRTIVKRKARLRTRFGRLSQQGACNLGLIGLAKLLADKVSSFDHLVDISRVIHAQTMKKIASKATT